MKILFISTPYTGHVNPTLNIIENLTESGHEVGYILTENWREEIEKRNAKLISYPQSKKLSTMIREMYFIGLEIGMEYDVIVYDQLFFLGKDLAEKLNKPVVRLFATVAINKKIMDEFITGGGFMSKFKTAFIRKRWTKKVVRGITDSIIDWTEEVSTNYPKNNIIFVAKEFQPYLEEFPQDYFHFVGLSIVESNN